MAITTETLNYYLALLGYNECESHNPEDNSYLSSLGSRCTYEIVGPLFKAITHSGYQLHLMVPPNGPLHTVDLSSVLEQIPLDLSHTEGLWKEANVQSENYNRYWDCEEHFLTIGLEFDPRFGVYIITLADLEDDSSLTVVYGTNAVRDGNFSKPVITGSPLLGKLPISFKLPVVSPEEEERREKLRLALDKYIQSQMDAYYKSLY